MMSMPTPAAEPGTGASPTRHRPDRLDARAEPSLAVVMATYRRPDLLARCLHALVHQSLAAEDYEVIVVDDGPDDATRATVEQVARQSAGRPRVRYLAAPHTDGRRGPAAARNAGWRATQAPIIAFTDDDTVPERDWLLEGARAMRFHRVAVSGRVVVPLDDAPTDHARNTAGLESAEFVTANAFVGRRALEQMGGFDERFRRAWREDSDLHFSLLSRCGPVGWAPKAVVVHPVRRVPWGASISQQANVAFDALLFKKHPHLFRQKVRRRPPWHYLVIVVSALASLGCAVAQAFGAAGLLAALALGTVLGFAGHRLRGTARTPSHVAEMLVTSAVIPFAAVYWRLVGSWRFKVLFP